jgi:hypothetical protein
MVDADPRQGAGEPAVASASRAIGSRLVAVMLGAVALGGCEGLVPMPDTALLKAQPAPKCEARSAAAAGEAGEAARLKKLDYEVQCYRHAEMIARNRLGRLQESIRASAKAAAAKQSQVANNP